MDYKENMEFLKHELEVSELVKSANEAIKGFNGFRLHPYIQVFKIEGIIQRYKDGLLTQDWVDNFFISEFYNLFDTISFVHGFFCNSRYINPYKYYIESSLILCYQGDYAGTLNLIIPVTEAVLVKFLDDHTGKDLRGRDRYKEIKRMPHYFSKILLERGKEDFRSSGYSSQQCEQLEQLLRERLDNWSSVLEDFLQNGLFKYVTANDVSKEMNRHAILHLFHPHAYNTLSNYIIIFNTLKMVSWMFSQIENTSILIDIDSKLLLHKVMHYEELIIKSKNLHVTKHILLKEHELHNVSDMNRKIPHKGIGNLGISASLKIVLMLKKRLDSRLAKLEMKKLLPETFKYENKE